jgi:hypothetical protein
MPGNYERTPEIRARQSAAMKGRFKGENSPNFGLKRSKETKDKLSKAKKGSPAPFKGKKHTEEAKAAMGFSKTGVLRNAEERKDRRLEYKQEWRDLHPEKIVGYDLKALEPRAVANSLRRRKRRIEGIIKLGGRCASPTCGWVNEDGTKGCTDFRILQFDHVEGGGTKDRKTFSFEKLCKDVITDVTGKYQLLCANCNWIKAFEKREFNHKYDLKEIS